MTSRKGPVRGVFEQAGSYYLVRADGRRRVWIKLCRVNEGLPALYAALARESAPRADTLASLIADWQRDVMPRHADRTQRDETTQCRVIAESFADFAPAQVRSPDVAEFLRHFRDRPRTHNAYRGMLGELMRYAEERGLREPGTNPVRALRTMSTPPRQRYITDSELRRIKVAAMRGKDGSDTRSGPMLCALIDMAYLTGQRIGDLLALEWGQVGPDGIAFHPAKTRGSTGARVLIEWTPKLRDVERRLRELRKERRAFTASVFTQQAGVPYTYWGAATAWRRAVSRAVVKDCHFHDVRAKALTDKERRDGMQAARTMGAHSTEQQTSDYVRARSGRKTGATR